MTPRARTHRCARTLALALLFGLAMLAPAGAVVPGEVNFQGLLLDDQGAPVNGPASFVFSLFAAETGGPALWTESHPGVSVLDGVYDVTLGATTPLSPGLLAGGSLFLEIEVDGETLTPRQRLLAVPYALQAASADAVDGLSSVFVTELYQHFNADGGGPPNDDPREGLGDTDGDTIANFIDPDNDDDGLSDVAELAQGSDLNLVTPTIGSLSPVEGEASLTTTVLVQGTNFEAGMSVAFGSESPAPQNLTSTSFQVDVGPQAEGAAGVTVTRSNGESGSASTAFDFVEFQPVLTSVQPDVVAFDATTTVIVTGENFLPGLQVAVGSQSPAPANLTPTSFQVDVGPQPISSTTFQVSYPSGKSDSAGFAFVGGSAIPRVVFLTSQSYKGDFGGLAGADAVCAAHASAASLPGTFLAWLADGTGDPASRFVQGPRPFALPSGTLVAIDYADLTDGSILKPIDMDENQFTPAATGVWSNVDSDGTVLDAGSNAHCSSWTSAVAPVLGRTGSSAATDSTWTALGSSVCSFSRRLYCFEQ